MLKQSMKTMNKIQLDNIQFTAQRGQPILDAALEQGIDFPFNCQLGSCEQCKCRLLAGEVRALGPYDYALAPDEIDNNFILACQSAAKSDLQISLNTNLDLTGQN